MTGSIPLSVLDLLPIKAGATPRAAVRDALDLARHVEAFGYHRYWVAEHHMTPGVASSAPAVSIALVAGATQHIRVGSGAVLMGHQTPLSVVEAFGLLDAAHPGRIDLGLGRSGKARNSARSGGRSGCGRPEDAAGPASVTGPAVDPGTASAAGPAPDSPSAPGSPGSPEAPEAPVREPWTTPGGLRIPAWFDPSPLLKSPRFRAQFKLLQQPGAETPDYAEQIDEILALLEGRLCTPDGIDLHAVPGEGADVEVWILGSSGGASAEVAGERGLPFAANYHISPATVLESIEGYRAAFRPSAVRERPHVAVSADVVVASDDSTARRLASPYALWVRSIRTGAGAMPYPSPEDAAAHEWTAEDRALVADRVETQFVGTPGNVARQLEILAAETGADELVITTITHDHADRVRSYELLAQEWSARATRSPVTTQARLAGAAAAAAGANGGAST